MKQLSIITDLKNLDAKKVDNGVYTNGQLQLRSGTTNIGIPISIVTGDSINAFVSGVNNGMFTATVNNTSTFTISGYSTNQIVTLVKENFILVRDQDYSISDIGLVTLAYPINIGQKIHYDIKYTSFKWDDIVGKPEIQKTGVIFSDTEPIQSNSDSYWFKNLGETDFNIGDGSGLIVLNAVNSDNAPDASLWFDNV